MHYRRAVWDSILFSIQLNLTFRRIITTDFDRARAGYSPDRLDALVWGLTELLVEPMPQWGILEVTRQRSMEIRNPPPPPPPPREYARGSVEWQRQQDEKKARGEE